MDRNDVLPICWGQQPSPDTGTRCIPIILDLAAATPQEIEFMRLEGSGLFDTPQSIFVDNSDAVDDTAANTLTITVRSTQQRLRVQGEHQATLPLLMGKNDALIVDRPTAGTVRLHLVNMPLPAAQWRTEA